jgi:hypothetical protein
MRMRNPGTSVLVIATIALFMAGLLLATYATGWAQDNAPPPVVFTPF